MARRRAAQRMSSRADGAAASARGRDGVLRIALPIVVLALGLAVWELVVRDQRHSALRAAGARA